MATAVVDLELDALPPGLSGLDLRYGQALLLLRWHRVAVGSVMVPLQHGSVAPDALATAIRDAVGKPLWFRLVHERLGWRPGPAPAIERHGPRWRSALAIGQTTFNGPSAAC